jgi:hypothetical protein
MNIGTQKEKMQDVIRDFKRFTNIKLIEAINPEHALEPKHSAAKIYSGLKCLQNKTLY